MTTPSDARNPNAGTIDMLVGKIVTVWFKTAKRDITGRLMSKCATVFELECENDKGQKTTWIVERSELIAIGIPPQPVE